jgi:hypothetical protein
MIFQNMAEEHFTELGPVVRRSDSAFHQIVIFSAFVKMLQKCETICRYIDEIKEVKKSKLNDVPFQR